MNSWSLSLGTAIAALCLIGTAAVADDTRGAASAGAIETGAQQDAPESVDVATQDAVDVATQGEMEAVEALLDEAALLDAEADGAAATEAQANPAETAQDIATDAPPAVDPLEAQILEQLEFSESEEPSPSAPPVAAKTASTTSGKRLGPIGFDANGKKGRIHTVVRKDTLWAISDAYLGTPWVWPSVWKENDGIENPHVIHPGDLIWITSNEMRRVTPEEARDMIGAGVPVASSDLTPPEVTTPDGADQAPAKVPQSVEVSVALDQVSVSVPSGASHSAARGRTISVPGRESMSFVTSETLDAASSIVGSPSPRVWVAEGDRIFIGLGEGEAEVGDQFTIFRDVESVRDIDGSLLGYHVEILGWAQVEEVHAETVLATIRHSVAEMEKGDRVVPRVEVASRVPIRVAPDGIEGRIVFFPAHRTVMGSIDYVYVNMGLIHGLEVGTALEVFSEGSVRQDRVRRTEVQTPDQPVADLVVVSVKPDSAVAFVVHTSQELEIGNIVRGGTDDVASWNQNGR